MCPINVSYYCIRSILFTSVYRKKPHSFINKQVLNAPHVPTSAPRAELREMRDFHGSHMPEGDFEDKLNKTQCMPGGEIWLKKGLVGGGELFHTGWQGKSLREFRKTLQIIGASWGAASGKELRRHKTCRFDPCVRKIPWRRTWQPIPVFLLREFPWTEEPGWLLPIELQRAGHNRSDLAGRQVWILEDRTFQRGNFWPIKMKKKKKGKEARKQSEQGVLGDRAREEEGAARPCRDWQTMVKTLDFTPNENI